LAKARSAIFAEAVVEFGVPGRSCDRSDESHLAGDANERFAQLLRRIDQQRLERDHRLGSRLERCVAGDLEMADHLDGAIARFRLAVGVTRQDGACGGLGIDGVGLAVPASELAIDPANLDDAQAHRGQRPREAGTIRAGALDSETMHGAVLA
jgi:hypothetical protein